VPASMGATTADMSHNLFDVSELSADATQNPDFSSSMTGMKNVSISVEHTAARAIWGTSIHAVRICRNACGGLAHNPKDRENLSSQIAWLTMRFTCLQKVHVDIAGSSHVLGWEGS
jgi:hypothetical protein